MPRQFLSQLVSSHQTELRFVGCGVSLCSVPGGIQVLGNAPGRFQRGSVIWGQNGTTGWQWQSYFQLRWLQRVTVGPRGARVSGGRRRRGAIEGPGAEAPKVPAPG